MDCVNNESFGFDTLRLKENNTRIKFFPTRSEPFRNSRRIMTNCAATSNV